MTLKHLLSAAFAAAIAFAPPALADPDMKKIGFVYVGPGHHAHRFPHFALAVALRSWPGRHSGILCFLVRQLHSGAAPASPP